MSRSLTIVIPSYQRRAALTRLLSGLAEQLAAPGLGEGVGILVVLDGSTDGSSEAVSAMSAPVPVHAVWQPNAGLAASARDAARGAALRTVVPRRELPIDGAVALTFDDGSPRRGEARQGELPGDGIERPVRPEACDRSATVEALPAIIALARSRGLDLVGLNAAP